MRAVLILAMPWIIPLAVVLIGLAMSPKEECPACHGTGPLPEGLEESAAHHYLFCAVCGKPNKPIT